jgi:hypothetical protein
VLHPQLLIYESDGRLAELLRKPVLDRRWALHEPRRRDACVRALARGAASVLLLKVDGDLRGDQGLLEKTPGDEAAARRIHERVRQYCLLEEVTRRFPNTATVILSDTEDARLTALAWDLGAACVLNAPQSSETLLDVIAGLLKPEPPSGSS